MNTRNKVPASLLNKNRGSIIINITMGLIVLLWSIPTLGLLISSFRGKNLISTTGWWTVFGSLFKTGQWTLSNYEFVLFSDQMLNAFINTILVTIPATVIPITIAAFAAYGLSWMEFPGRKILFIAIVGLMVVPLQMTLLPLYGIYNLLQLNGTLLGIWLAHAGFGMPLAIFLLFGFISTLPKDLIEAARIDGAKQMVIFRSLVLPLATPAIAAFATFQFLWVWNDLLVALVFFGTGPKVVLVTTRLSEMVGSRGQDWHALTAGAFISMLVPLIIFFVLQRYFVRGIIAGSVKG